MSIEDEIYAQMVTNAGIDVEVDRFAHQIADEIRDLTPEFGNLPPKRGAPPHGQPGDAKDAIKVELAPGKRHARRVISRDYKAIWIELGSRHMPEYAPFAKVAAMHGGTGPEFEEGIERAQGHLRSEVEKLTKMLAAGAGATAEEIAEQRLAVDRARNMRSAAFNAARRGPRRGRRR